MTLSELSKTYSKVGQNMTETGPEGVTKTAFLCITGAPNVGKSSLLNAILGQKIAIVSPKPQTTRTCIVGIHTEGDLQVVFTDTPGLLIPKDTLGQHMVRDIERASGDNDALLLVVEGGKKTKPAELAIIDNLKKRHQKAILVINKVDIVNPKERLIPQMLAFSELYDFEAIIPVSALTGNGIPILMEAIAKLAQPGPFFYPQDEITDQPERVVFAEYIREQILHFMRQEVPHGVAVMIESFEETEEGIEAGAVIYCERLSHKGMLIGKGGAMMKKIKLAAQKNLSTFLGVPVHLTLWVKVKPDWRDSEFLIRDFGLSSGEKLS